MVPEGSPAVFAGAGKGKSSAWAAADAVTSNMKTAPKKLANAATVQNFIFH